MNRVLTGDTVMVMVGKSKGFVGEVLKVKGNDVWVKHANQVKKHVKPNPDKKEKGGIVEKEASLDLSNVLLYNPETKKGERIGFRFDEKEGQQVKVRYFKSNGKLVRDI